MTGGGVNSERNELAQFHELYPSSTMEEEDEAVFKKPKPKVGGTGGHSQWIRWVGPVGAVSG